MFHLLHDDFPDGHGWGCSKLTWGYCADHPKGTISSNRGAGTFGTVAAGQRSRSAPSANDAGPWMREGTPQIQRERERAAARPLLLSLLSAHVFFLQFEVSKPRSSFPFLCAVAHSSVQYYSGCVHAATIAPVTRNCPAYTALFILHHPHITFTPAACEVRDGDYKLRLPRRATWNPKTIPS
jgi:hypothetical protein